MSTTQTDDLATRYGTPSPARRRAIIVVSGVVGVVALAWLAWAAWFQSTPDVQSSMPSFDVVDTHTVTADVIVKTRSDSVVASCLLRAFGEDHSIVGERNFRVGPIDDQVRQQVTFRTEREATSVELIGCTTPDQNRPR